MNPFLFKITLMPLAIGLVTLVSRRWGNKVGGLIASLPWVAGPILLFFILEQGKAFGIQSVHGILTGIIAWVCFTYTYARLAPARQWPVTVSISYLVYVGVAWLINFFDISLPVSYGLAMSSAVLALRYFPKAHLRSAPVRRLPFDIPLRMLVATLFVVAVTWLANTLGPAWSGILTPFPIMTSVLAIFTHHLQGSGAAILILRGLLIGVLGFTTFFFLQAFFLPVFSVALSFFLALLINMLINAIASRVW
ncbi:hypothetical protein GCM10023189_10080 [Nibrella saemangeumensis]|uniref:Uncharacterized protein n=1 Tax=Nibrella saemangeumensis TaxID=1084526 RepID=A0ABP8MII5_9BACT